MCVTTAFTSNRKNFCLYGSGHTHLPIFSYLNFLYDLGYIISKPAETTKTRKVNCSERKSSAPYTTPGKGPWCVTYKAHLKYLLSWSRALQNR